VSHHPPITAYECQGKAGWRLYTNNKTKSKFTGKSLNFTSQYKVYIEFPTFNELYEISTPVVCASNLIIGTPYVDLGGMSVIRNVKNDERAEIEYFKRGWTDSNNFRLEGHVFKGT
jgi:hypothetical protein